MRFLKIAFFLLVMAMVGGMVWKMQRQSHQLYYGITEEKSIQHNYKTSTISAKSTTPELDEPPRVTLARLERTLAFGKAVDAVPDAVQRSLIDDKNFKSAKVLSMRRLIDQNTEYFWIKANQQGKVYWLEFEADGDLDAVVLQEEDEKPKLWIEDNDDGLWLVQDNGSVIKSSL